MVIAGAISQAFGTKTPDLRLLQVLLLPSSEGFLLPPPPPPQVQLPAPSATVGVEATLSGLRLGPRAGAAGA